MTTTVVIHICAPIHYQGSASQLLFGIISVNEPTAIQEPAVVVSTDLWQAFFGIAALAAQCAAMVVDAQAHAEQSREFFLAPGTQGFRVN